jgi:DNA polymerase-3 subunit epsilon
MGLFDKLVAGFKGAAAGAQASSERREQTATDSAPSAPVVSPGNSGITLTMSYPGPQAPAVPVPATEVTARASQYAFVLDDELGPLATADQWWHEDTHKRRLRDGSEKAFAWLMPFMPLEIAKLEPLRRAQEWGPHAATALAKELRALIREKRKAKEPHAELLKALYGACIAADLSAAIAFEGTQPHTMARYVSLAELEAVSIDFGTMGYQCLENLGKTDAKWLVEAFGEPQDHQSFQALWPHIPRNAIARYCWESLGKPRDGDVSPEARKSAMQLWLNDLVRRNLGYHKEWEERNASRAAQLADLASTLAAAWVATNETFVVADLETTGLSAETDEIIELAAVRVSPAGSILAEFSVLVRPAKPIPAVITKLTGITQPDVDRDGQTLAQAMKAFLAFVESHPVYFHNAPFDAGFLKKASAATRLKFANPVHDTLPMARQAWPSLGTYKLAVLAQHIGAPVPTHRGLADVKVVDVNYPDRSATTILAGGSGE